MVCMLHTFMEALVWYPRVRTRVLCFNMSVCHGHVPNIEFPWTATTVAVLKRLIRWHCTWWTLPEPDIDHAWWFQWTSSRHEHVRAYCCPTTPQEHPQWGIRKLTSCASSSLPWPSWPRAGKNWPLVLEHAWQKCPSTLPFPAAWASAKCVAEQGKHFMLFPWERW